MLPLAVVVGVKAVLDDEELESSSFLQAPIIEIINTISVKLINAFFIITLFDWLNTKINLVLPRRQTYPQSYYCPRSPCEHCLRTMNAENLLAN